MVVTRKNRRLESDTGKRLIKKVNDLSEKMSETYLRVQRVNKAITEIDSALVWIEQDARNIGAPLIDVVWDEGRDFPTYINLVFSGVGFNDSLPGFLEAGVKKTLSSTLVQVSSSGLDRESQRVTLHLTF